VLNNLHIKAYGLEASIISDIIKVKPFVSTFKLV